MGTPRASKEKGRKLQNETRDKLLDVFSDLEAGDVKCAIMGEGGEDIKLSPAARKKLGISIECKNLKKIAAFKFYKQASDNAAGAEPVVVMKQNHSKPLVMIDVDYFLKLLKG